MSLAAIERGLEAGAISIPAARKPLLAAHLALLEKWNRVHNLTAVREPEAMVALHVLDSLSILPHLGEAQSLLDVGSGGGFPGIPLAIAREDLAVTLLDSSHKKCAFLEQAKAELGLSNVTVACERVESWKPEHRFDAVVSRAFSELADFVAQAAHLVAPGGRFIAMKGVYPYDEIARLPDTWRAARVEALQVPGLDAKRHLVFLEPA
jgi:16S rRNA (guanine527-N7)-methyltransferase